MNKDEYIYKITAGSTNTKYSVSIIKIVAPTKHNFFDKFDYSKRLKLFNILQPLF